MPITKWFKQTNEKHVNLFTANYRLPKDSSTSPERKAIFASRKEVPMCAKDGGPDPDAVAIVPVLKTSSGPKIALVKQFRPVLGKIEYDLPAGKIDKGESHYEAAKRELLEETGLTISSIKDVSPIMFTSGGLTDESFVIYFAEVEGDPSRKFQEESEDIEVELFDASAAAMLANDKGAIISGKCWLVLYMIKNLGNMLWESPFWGK